MTQRRPRGDGRRRGLGGGEVQHPSHPAPGEKKGREATRASEAGRQETRRRQVRERRGDDGRRGTWRWRGAAPLTPSAGRKKRPSRQRTDLVLDPSSATLLVSVVSSSGLCGLRGLRGLIKLSPLPIELSELPVRGEVRSAVDAQRGHVTPDTQRMTRRGDRCDA